MQESSRVWEEEGGGGDIVRLVWEVVNRYEFPSALCIPRRR